MAVVGRRYFVGDNANQNPKLPGYWLVNLHASYQVTKNVQVFGLINNLFNKRYALFGTYFDPDDCRECGAADRLDRPSNRSARTAVGGLRRHTDHLLI